MVFLNEEDLAENVKNFLSFMTDQMMNSAGKTEKMLRQKCLQ